MSKTLIVILFYTISMFSQQTTKMDYYEFEREGKFGKVNSSGNIIIPAKYEWFGEGIGELIPAKLNNSYGVINLKNQIVIPFVYDYVEMDKQFIKVSLNSKYGWINSKNQTVLPIKYDSAYHLVDGSFLVRLNGKTGLLDKKGNVILDIEYEGLGDFIEQVGYSDNKILFEKDKKYGYLDRKKNVVIEPKFDYASSFHNNKAIVVINRKYGIINQKGEFEIEPTFSNIFYYKGFYRTELNGKEGYLNKNLTVLLEAEYDDVEEFVDGLAVVQKNNKFGLINDKGAFVIPLIYDGARHYSEGLIPVLKNDKWGYVNEKNEVIIDFIFTGNVSSFSNHSAIYFKRNSSSMAYHCCQEICGVINKKGEVVITPKYKSIGNSFNKGVYIVEINNRDYLINLKEEIIFDLKKIELQPELGF